MKIAAIKHKHAVELPWDYANDLPCCGIASVLLESLQQGKMVGAYQFKSGCPVAVKYRSLAVRGCFAKVYDARPVTR
jgi:hypothetical protein